MLIGGRGLWRGGPPAAGGAGARERASARGRGRACARARPRARRRCRTPGTRGAAGAGCGTAGTRCTSARRSCAARGACACGCATASALGRPWATAKGSASARLLDCRAVPPAAEVRPMRPDDVAAAEAVARSALYRDGPREAEPAVVTRGRRRVAHLQRTDPGGAWVAEDERGEIVGT